MFHNNRPQFISSARNTWLVRDKRWVELERRRRKDLRKRMKLARRRAEIAEQLGVQDVMFNFQEQNAQKQLEELKKTYELEQ